MPAIGERLNISEFKMSQWAKTVKYRLSKKTPFFVHSSVLRNFGHKKATTNLSQNNSCPG